MVDITLGVQLYTLREFGKTPEGIEDIFKKVSAMGYETVQVSGLGSIEPERLAEISKQYNLPICITHTPLNRILNDLDACIKEHKIFGCDILGLGAMPGEYRSYEGYLKFCEEMNEVSKKLADNGMKFGYHNHRFEFQKYNGTIGMDILIESTDPINFTFTMDTYWIQAGGQNPVDYIYKLKDRIGVIHYKDMAIVDDKQIYAEIGEGNLDFEKIIKACVDTKIKTAVVEQDECQRDPYESLAISYKNTKELFAKI